MAGPRGYSSYRGRASKGKFLLAILLTVIILVGAGFLLLQRYIVYDSSGVPRLQLPDALSSKVSENDPPEVDLIIEPLPEPEEPTPVGAAPLGCGIQLSATPITGGSTFVAQATQVSDGGEWSDVAVTLKDIRGNVYFDSAAAKVGTVKTAADTGETLTLLTASSAYRSIARISCFHDSRAANADVDGMGLKNTGGYIFYDGNNSQWLDPAKESARQYLTNIIAEAEALGFDEILLTDVSYPTEGKLNKIDFGELVTSAEAPEACKAQMLTAFLQEVRGALSEDTVLSVELDADTILSGQNEAAGQVLADIVPLVDRVYAVTTEAEAPILRNAVMAVSDLCTFAAEVTQVAVMPDQYLLLAE